MLRDDLELPEVTEGEVVRYFTHLSQLNFSIDTNFYPLGSCTMKYNPKLNEAVAALPGFAMAHPAQPERQVQGALEAMHRLPTLPHRDQRTARRKPRSPSGRPRRACRRPHHPRGPRCTGQGAW